MKPTISFNLAGRPRKDGSRSVDLCWYHNAVQETPMATGWTLRPEEWADMHGRPRAKERKMRAEENRAKLKELEARANRIVDEMEVYHWPAFKQAWKEPDRDTGNVFWWYYRRIKGLPLKTARGYYDSFRWVYRKATGSNPLPFQAIRETRLIQPTERLAFHAITIAWLKSLETDLEKAGRSANTIGIYMRNLRTVFNDARDEGIVSLKQYPFSTDSGKRRYSPPVGRKKPKALTKQQIAKLMACHPENPTERWAVDLFLFGYFANGQDFGDYFRLKWQDRIFDDFLGRHKAVIDRTKTKTTKRAGAPVVIIFNDVCEAVIQRYSVSRNPDDYIFPVLKPEWNEEQKARKIGSAIRTINRALKRVARRIGLPDEISSRWARHSHASGLATNSELTIFDIQQQLGHSSPQTTERYIRSLVGDSTLLEAYDRLKPDWEEKPGEAARG